MSDYKNIEIFKKNRSTLKKTSYDDANKEYMSDSLFEVIDFDKVKEDYCFPLGLEEQLPKSCDALCFLENKIIFIEFKNGKVETFNVRKKIYDTILIFSDIVGCSIKDTRNNVEYILVYDKIKNETSREYRDYPKRKIQRSKSFNLISDSISKLAKKEIVKFKIWDFQKYLLKDVHTYTKEEFEENFIKKCT